VIDFRYHLVSIVAIFLALAVGIVLGTTLLENPAIRSAEELTRQLAADKQEQRGQIDELLRRNQATDSFVTTLTPKLVEGELAGEQVLLVEAPGVNASTREAEQEMLTTAGAVITGRLSLADRYFDPKSAGVLDGLVNQLKPAEMTFATTATAHDKAATLLAATVMTADQAQVGVADQTTAAVLTGLEAGGFLDLDGEPDKRATLAVMLAPETPFEGDGAPAQAAAFTTLAGGLDAGGKGVVIAGPPTSAVAGGVITALREHAELPKRVSTVDRADLPEGRVVTVYALREQVSGGTGQYGTGQGASAFQPVEPTPTPTSTESGS
jgi:hypothetical protein